MPVQTRIQIRRDTEANWSSTNPTLSDGEISFDTTNKRIKIGNGSTAWNSLDYASGASSVEISETAPSSPEAGSVWFNSTEGRTYIYYDSTWVDLNPGFVGPQGPIGPNGLNGDTGPTGLGYLGVTSTTSTTVSTGTTTFAVPYTGAYTQGTRVRVAVAGLPSNWEEGRITAITLNTSITVNVDLVGGSGTFSNWIFSVAGERGATGPSGDPTLVINQQTGSYPAVIGDASKLIEILNAGPTTFSIPTDASVNFPVGTQISILQTGAGQVTIAAVTPGTTTINGTPGLKLRTQWSAATLIKRGANLWVASGDLSA
jgi:hypothetical protein